MNRKLVEKTQKKQSQEVAIFQNNKYNVNRTFQLGSVFELNLQDQQRYRRNKAVS